VLQLGQIQIDWVSDGRFKLDGGAMFGPVPRPLWEQKIKPDDRNRIWLGLNCILLTTPHGRVLLDTGLGNKLSPKKKEIFAQTSPADVVDSLSQRGLSPEDIDHVVLSHADFDHIGGATRVDDTGIIRATFPRAQYHIRIEEWEDLTQPDERAKSTYFQENWTALAQSGQVCIEKADGEWLPGIHVYHSGGHTRGHVVIVAESEGERAVYLGDLMPTRHHLNPLWVMAYDNFPLTSIEQRQRWLTELKRGGTYLLFYHDTALGAARLNEAGAIAEAVALPDDAIQPFPPA
jgi:glyoxylase-like metal-dependent hydrolase (beta-lactamase superfamily II)